METQPTNVSENSASPEEKKWLLPIGYATVAVSFFLYCLYELMSFGREGNLFIIFFSHFALACFYMGMLLVDGKFGIRKSWRPENIHFTALLFILGLISAYALNRLMNVFEDSVDWWSVCLVISSITLMSFRYFDRLPEWIKYLQVFLLGATSLMYLYLSLMVGDVYVLGLFGLLAIGIGIHAFVPISIFTACIFLLIQNVRKVRFGIAAITAGVVVPLIFIGWFASSWAHRVKAMNSSNNQAVLKNDLGIPAYIETAQQLKNDWISERILKNEIVYSTAGRRFGSWDGWRLGGGVTWEEKKKHDPLVLVSGIFSKSSLSSQERVKILNIISKDSYRAAARFWSGDKLTTSYIVSDIDIYPALHLAYTEKYINVKNNSADSWNTNNEAIYTFQLPEGSVVTSLSLWVDGKERKGMLTSKQNAAKAYNTIVGRERRDPSVVHWQEGNTVSVRVFPCTQKEERKFKIGFSSLLPVIGNRIVYNNITFNGPDVTDAPESTRIRFMTEPKNAKLPYYLMKNEKGNFVGEHEYDPDLKVELDSPPILFNQFSHDHFKYSLSAYEPSLTDCQIRKIYLDINNTWTDSELKEIESLLGENSLLAEFENELIKLNSSNWSSVSKKLQERNFSTFPFHLIADPGHSLVVTKGDHVSVRLSDFSESLFAQSVSNLFLKGVKIKVFNLSNFSSTYINTLRELRAFEFGSGDVDRLTKLLKEKKFPRSDESESRVVVYEAGITINRIADAGDSKVQDNAPDHLARLFAYNDVMRRAGVDYLNDSFSDPSILDEASMANIVSPVSSLIVLEKQEDYDRFDIKESENSLKNASKKSSGAVPEPHEWALIAVFILFLIFLRVRR